MKIKFHHKIYTKGAIASAVKDFQELASFSIDKTGDYIEVEVSNIDPDIHDCFREEFTNYVLCLQKKKIVS